MNRKKEMEHQILYAEKLFSIIPFHIHKFKYFSGKHYLVYVEY